MAFQQNDVPSAICSFHFKVIRYDDYGSLIEMKTTVGVSIEKCFVESLRSYQNNNMNIQHIPDFLMRTKH